MGSEDQDAPAPRLCYIIQWPDFDGFGFNLHAEKNRTGQFIGKVDENSPAELAGLQQGDRIVEVNDVNIANENHKQVVARIKAVPKETRLLVVDEKADDWYKSRGIVVKTSMKNVTHMTTPVPRPGHEPADQEQLECRGPSVQPGESVDEESGEPVRNIEDGEVENGPIEITTTSESEEKELSFRLSEQDLRDDSKEPIDQQPTPPPSSVPKDDSQEAVEENLDSSISEPAVAEEKVLFENNVVVELDKPAKSENLDDESVMNLKNEVNNELDTEDGDRDSLKEKRSPAYIEDELKQEFQPPRTETPSSDKKSLEESPRSSRSSEHRETPPTTPTTPLPATPEPVISEKEEDLVKSNGHSNGQKPTSGLNLNMSAQEMREMLAQRKKKDVRQEQVDMRTKYMMIQKM